MARKIKVLWPHNFSPEVKNSGVFMYVLADAIRNSGVDIHTKYLGNLRSLKSVVFALYELKSAMKNYDITHAQFGSVCGWLVSKGTGKKILGLHGSDWYGTSFGSLGTILHGALQRWFTRSSLNKYDGIIVPSRRMLEEVKTCYFKNNLVYIPDGIDLDCFYPIDKIQARHALGIFDDDSPWVLFPSIVVNSPVKRYWLVEQAYLEAKKVIPNLKLKVASNVDHKDMRLFYNACDVVLMASTHEGGPLSIKEALACNVPFVSTDVGDLKKISDQEQSCFIVASDPKALGNAIINAINQPKPSDLRKHVEHMHLDTIAEDVLKVYKNVLQ